VEFARDEQPSAKLLHEPSVDYLAILRGMWRRHKMLMSVIFLAVLIPGLAFLYLTSEPTFESGALLALEPSVLDQMPQFREVAKRESVGSLMIYLKSRSFSAAVVEALPKESFEELATKSRYTDYVLLVKNWVKERIGRQPTVLSPHERAIAELQGARMEVAPSQQSAGVLALRGRASKPRVAMDLVNSYIQVLLSRSQNANQDASRKVREFLEQQVQQIRENLSHAELALSDFQQRTGRSASGTRPESEADALSRLEAALAEAQANKEVVLAQGSALRQMLNRAATKPPETPAATDANAEAGTSSTDWMIRFDSFKAAQERLMRLEAKLASLRERYTDAHPLVQATQQEVLKGQMHIAQLARELPPAPVKRDARKPEVAATPSLLIDAQTQLAALQTEEAALQAKIDTLKMQVDRLAKKPSVRNLGAEEVQIGNLRRAVEVNRNLLTVLTDKLMASRIREQSDIGTVRVIDPASYPVQPTRSQEVKYAMLLLTAAAGLAFGAGFGVEFWRRPVETEADIPKSRNLLALGSVGTIDSGSANSTNGMRKGLLVSSGIHRELYRSICATIETERLRSPFRSVLVTSPNPGEGKSTTVINLGHVFNEFGLRVLIIEADLRRPVLATRLSLTREPGLKDFLAGAASFEQVCHGFASGLTIIPGHVASGNATSLLASRRVQELLAFASDRFDLILCDSAPVLVVPDNILLLKNFDRALLVAKAATTTQRELSRAARVLQLANGKILGVILNQAKRQDVQYYQRRYRKYYGVGDHRSKDRTARA
jgi:capsular exopolysaccharide synthesis family protein